MEKEERPVLITSREENGGKVWLVDYIYLDKCIDLASKASLIFFNFFINADKNVVRANLYKQTNKLG